MKRSVWLFIGLIVLGVALAAVPFVDRARRVEDRNLVLHRQPAPRPPLRLGPRR